MITIIIKHSKTHNINNHTAHAHSNSQPAVVKRANKNVQGCLQQFTSAELLDGYKCDKCNKRVKVSVLAIVCVCVCVCMCVCVCV